MRVVESLRVVRADTSDEMGRSTFATHGSLAMNTPLTRSANRVGATHGIVLGLAAIAGLASTGCQVDVGGQTLPSAYYLQDDIQYFPAGPEFKLSKEAAAQKAYKKEIGAEGCGGNCGGGCASCGH